MMIIWVAGLINTKANLSKAELALLEFGNKSITPKYLNMLANKHGLNYTKLKPSRTKIKQIGWHLVKMFRIPISSMLSKNVRPI